jgi:hypothetical protein
VDKGIALDQIATEAKSGSLQVFQSLVNHRHRLASGVGPRWVRRHTAPQFSESGEAIYVSHEALAIIEIVS